MFELVNKHNKTIFYLSNMLLVDDVLEEGGEGGERTSARAERALGRLKGLIIVTQSAT